MITTKSFFDKLARRLMCLVLVAALLPLGVASAASSDKFIIGMVFDSGAVLNPLQCSQRDLISLNELVFESVITLDDYLQPTGELALNWEVSGSVYTFNIRDNVRFHDGTYLSAQDVYASYSRIMELGENGSPYYTRCSYIKKMEVTGMYTLEVTGKYESYLTLYAMTFPVLQRNTVTWDMAIGTGPYWYMSYDTEYIQVDANPYWWKKAPTIDSICGFRYDDTGDALEALSTGEVDAVATRSQTAAIGRLLNDRQSVDYTTLTYEMLVPNIKGDIFSDVKTRQALMYAIDVTTIASNIYMDMVTESEVPVITGSWLYEPQSAIYYQSQERALQLLYEAGWGDYNSDGILDRIVDNVLVQFEFTLYTYVDDATGTRTHAAELIRDQLHLLGIEVTVSTQSKANVQKKLKNGSFEMVLCGINMSVLPDLTFLLNSSGRMNYSGYSDAGMNSLLYSLYETQDETQFKYLFSQLQLKVANDLPFLGLFFRKGTLMTTADISGLDAVIEGDVFRGIEYVQFS